MEKMAKFEIVFLPKAIKQFSKLEAGLQEEVEEAIEALRDSVNHERLRVHKLHGILKSFHSAKVDYSYRIIFAFDGPLIVIALIGDHAMYR